MKDSVPHAEEFVLFLSWKKKIMKYFLMKKKIPKSMECYIVTLSALDMRKIFLKSV